MNSRVLVRAICGTGAATVVAVYLAAVGVNSQVAGTANWWPYTWLWYLAAAWSILAAGWLVLSIQEGGAGPAFRLRVTGDAYMLRRTRRRTAYDVVFGQGKIGSTAMSGLWGNGGPLGDLAHNDEVRITVIAETVWFAWIDGKRLRSRHIAVPPGPRGQKIYGTDKPTLD